MGRAERATSLFGPNYFRGMGGHFLTDKLGWPFLWKFYLRELTGRFPWLGERV